MVYLITTNNICKHYCSVVVAFFEVSKYTLEHFVYHTMIIYKLDQPISGEILLSKIVNLINSLGDVDKSKYFLVIDTRTISNEDTSLIPKLEHKNLEP